MQERDVIDVMYSVNKYSIGNKNALQHDNHRHSATRAGNCTMIV